MQHFLARAAATERSPSGPGSSASSYLALLAGFMSRRLDGMVLLGWYTHNAALIQVNSAFVLMQCNTVSVSLDSAQ